MKRKINRKQNKAKELVSCKGLADKYRLLSELMDHVPDVIYFKDKKGRLLMVNQAHARGLNLKPEEVVGKTDFDFFSRKRAEMMLKDDMHVMKTGKPVIDKVERATRPDGVDNYVTTTKIPRYDAEGKVIGLIGITRDITHRMQLKRLKEDKERAEKKIGTLEELGRMKSEFVAVVSHELRTPLTLVKEAVTLILDEITGSINEKQKQLCLTARNNIDRLNKIIEDLLDISRIERGMLKLRYSLVNLNDLLLGHAEFFKKSAQQKGIHLDYHLPTKQINIFIDAERIDQVITNLINNAIKFTEENGKIKVEIKIFEDKVRLGIIDTGVGIAKQDLPKLFGRFVQVSKVEGYERKGLGLGLSIARELIEKHGGEIWAESKLGVGSKFYFTLSRFYTAKVLSTQIRERINNLLSKGITAYLINPVIVNFEEFRERIKVKPRKLFKDLAIIIADALLKFQKTDKGKPRMILQDYQKGEYGIIFPEATETKAYRLCALLKDRIREYFRQNKAKDIFINMGILPYPFKAQRVKAQQLLANIYVKKIYIGSTIRRCRRINYKVNIEIILDGNKTQSSETVDISMGGICFISEIPLKTDAQIKIKLQLSKKTPLHIKCRVAWIKNIKGIPNEPVNQYRIGLEFIDLERKERMRISKFIKSYSL